MGTMLPTELLDLLPNPLLIGIVWAMAVCWVAWLLLRLIPVDERDRAAYRYLRAAINWAAFLLAMAVLVVVVISYALSALQGAPLPPG